MVPGIEGLKRQGIKKSADPGFSIKVSCVKSVRNRNVGMANGVAHASASQRSRFEESPYVVESALIEICGEKVQSGYSPMHTGF